VPSGPPGRAAGSAPPLSAPEPEPGAPDGAGRYDHAVNPSPDGSEPDARFTFANERTFLAWNRTALALVVAGLAIVQLLPPFAGVPLGRHVIAVPLILLGGIVSVTSYVEWRRDQRALRRGEPLPASALPRILAGSITVLALLAAGLVLVSAARQ
jgi:putative membrane protein